MVFEKRGVWVDGGVRSAEVSISETVKIICILGCNQDLILAFNFGIFAVMCEFTPLCPLIRYESYFNQDWKSIYCNLQNDIHLCKS